MYSYPICYRPEAASDVISSTFVSQIISYIAEEFSDHQLNRHREIWLKVVGDGILTVSFRDNLQPEVACDIIRKSI